MFCKNCGALIDETAFACTYCGTQKGMGYNFCEKCGTSLVNGACPTCNPAPNYGTNPYTNPNPYGNPQPMPGQQPYQNYAPAPGYVSDKSKVAAGILAIFLGTLGIHNFYLGYSKKGLIQLLVSLLLSWTVVAPIAIEVWAIVEAVQIFTGEIKDPQGRQLRD